MAAIRIFRGACQYAADFRTILRFDFRATLSDVCAEPASLGIRPCVCYYTTEVVGSTIANEENDPDQFGVFKKSYIEPSRRLKRPLASVKKVYQPARVQSNPKQKNKLSSTTKKSTEEPTDADVFGTIGRPLKTDIDDIPTDDEGDKIEEDYLKRIRPKPWQTPGHFTSQMKSHIQERRLGEALALFNDMKQKYRIQPDSYMFNILIGGCGRSGYMQMAFKLYKEMKERQAEPDGSTYTGLFNACANSPFPEDGLKRATMFYQKITEKGISLNAKTYHAAIKAFGRCGNLQMAFHLVDEMVQKGVGVTTETLCFLLMGCASDQDSGFLHAIRVWKMMKTKQLQHDSYSYNLLLRIVRDCGMGDPQIAEQLLFNGNSLDHSDNKRLQMPADHSENDMLTNTLSVPETRLPDILSPASSPGSVVALQAAETASERLLMLGGVLGIVNRMKKDKVQPQIKTFTELLEIIPSETQEEESLLKIMNERNVHPDIDFFNILIKKRSKRRDFNSAKNVLQLIAKHSLHVDIATFGTLAIGCEQWKDAELFLHDMEEAGFRPNIQIMGALAHNACITKNFWYLIDVLKIIQEKEILAHPRLIEELESCIVSTKHFIVEKEKPGASFKNKDYFINSFKVFIMYYKQWLQEVKMELPGHPWEAYGYVPRK